jgi:hypothetical protein
MKSSSDSFWLVNKTSTRLFWFPGDASAGTARHRVPKTHDDRLQSNRNAKNNFVKNEMLNCEEEITYRCLAALRSTARSIKGETCVLLRKENQSALMAASTAPQAFHR